MVAIWAAAAEQAAILAQAAQAVIMPLLVVMEQAAVAVGVGTLLIAAAAHMAAVALDYLGKVRVAVAAIVAVRAEVMEMVAFITEPEHASVAALVDLQMVALAVFVFFGPEIQDHSQVPV
jgi:hypothetical protein